MDNNLKLTLVSIFLLFFALLLQSTVLNFVSIAGIKPDITLMVVIFLGFRKGSNAGQISGFFAGLFEDFMSLTPPGFNALIKAIIGYCYGLLLGGFIIDAVVIPIVFLAIGTLIKGILSWLFVLIFSLSQDGVSIFSIKFLIELLYTSLTAPFVFALLKLIKIMRVVEKEKV
jgi:rod shape-determining protein MreD